VRATNWVGDAVMSLPALRVIRRRFPKAHITVVARPWVADLYARESFCDQLILHTAAAGAGDWVGKWRTARDLRRHQFDCVILLQNAFEAALLAWLARIPVRIGYNRDGRGFLLTHPVPVPETGSIPPHQSFYYLELLRRAGFLDRLPAQDEPIRLEGAEEAARAGRISLAAAGFEGPVIGVSPGAAFGGAKRWLPERFADSAIWLSRLLHAGVAVFGSGTERSLCEAVAGRIRAANVPVRNFAGETALKDFIQMAAACRVYLTNDSGAMHIASALGVPTVAVFGATDHIATGPTGPLASVVREPADCSPCFLRECPIDHRCMTAVTVESVIQAAVKLMR